MIHYRCADCGAWQGAEAAAAGSRKSCRSCGHVNICPATPGVTAASERPLASRRSLRPVWVAGLLALLAATTGFLWLGREQGHRQPPATPADSHQRALLERNVGQPGEPDLVALYAELNHLHFSGRLAAMPVRWDAGLDDVGKLAGRAFTLEGMYGRVGRREVILLNPRMKADPSAVRRALAHEMVHAHLALGGDGSTNHGPAFKAELRRLADAHAFEGIAATDEERATLRAWLDAEAVRLDQDQREVKTIGAAIDADRAAFERDLAELEARARSVDRPSPSEMDALQARGDHINARVVAVNARIAQGRQALARFNGEVARYNLMVVYPDGMDDEPLMPARVWADEGAR